LREGISTRKEAKVEILEVEGETEANEFNVIEDDLIKGPEVEPLLQGWINVETIQEEEKESIDDKTTAQEEKNEVDFEII
jgi:hypothetical protein